MNHRIRQILRSLFAAAIVATLTILFLRGRDPSFLNLHRPSVGEAALDRVIDVDINDLPLSEAAEVLSQKAGVPITFEDGAVRKAAGRVITLRAEHLPLDEVLIEICRQAADALEYRWSDVFDYRPTSDGIVIGTVSSSMQHMVVDLYDFRDVSRHGVRPDEQLRIPSPQHNEPGIVHEQRGLKSAAVVGWGLGEQPFGRWSIYGARQGLISPFDERLLLRLTPSTQRQLRKFLRFLADLDSSTMPGRSDLPATRVLEHGQWVPYTPSPAEIALRRTVPPLRVTNCTGGQLITELSQECQVKIEPNWSWVDFGVPVDWSTLSSESKAGGVPLSDVLSDLCGPAFGEGRIDFRPDGEKIEVNTRSAVLTTRMYDMRRYFSSTGPQDDGIAAGKLVNDCLSSIQKPPGYLGGWPDDYQFVGPQLIVTTTWSHQGVIAARLKKLIESATAQPVR